MGRGRMVHEVLYIQVRSRILKLIAEKNYHPNELLPSEAEIAKLCGVSKMTSKLAFNMLAEEGIITRIPRKGNFLNDIDPAKIHEALAEQRPASSEVTGNAYILLVVPTIDQYIGDIIKNIERRAAERGYSLSVKVTGETGESEESILSMYSKAPEVKGILLFPLDHNNCGTELLQLKLANYPIVILDRVFKEIAFDCVMHDFISGTKNMVQYLVERGHERIGFLSTDTSIVTSTEEKYQGFMAGMIETGKPIQGRWICTVNGNQNLDEITAFLKDNGEMTAVVCSDDYLAANAYNAAGRLGRSVPEDLAITGFSDNGLLRYFSIGITTVRQPVEELCEQAVTLLVSRMKEPFGSPQAIRIPVVLIPRESA